MNAMHFVEYGSMITIIPYTGRTLHFSHFGHSQKKKVFSLDSTSMLIIDLIHSDCDCGHSQSHHEECITVAH